MNHAALDDSLPAWLKAYVCYMNVAHMADLFAARFALEERDTSPQARRLMIGMCKGKASEARAQAAGHMPFPIRAVRSMGSLN